MHMYVYKHNIYIYTHVYKQIYIYIHVCWRTVYRPAKCNVFVFPVTIHVFYRSCDLAHEVDGVGWGGVGWGMLTFVGTCTWLWCYPMNLSLELAHDVDAVVSCHTGGIDSWWKMMKEAVPNSLVTTKGAKINKKIWQYIRSFQWRWENQIDLLSATGKALQIL